MRATILIFVLALTAVYGFYAKPNMHLQQAVQRGLTQPQLYQALGDYFYQLSAGITGSVDPAGRR